VHGGGWTDGRKGTPGTVLLARGLAGYGYVTFDINYRLLGHGGQFPNSVQDVEDAIAYLSTRADRLRLDLGKLGVVGVSSGGYLALMAGYRPNIPPFAPPHYPETHVHVRAVGSFFAPPNLTVSARKAAGLPQLLKLQAYLGSTFDQNPELYRRASPQSYIETAVPTTFWYGRADPMIPVHATFELYKQLKQRKIRSQLFDLPGAPHSLMDLSPQARRNALDQLVLFLTGVLFRQSR
jgi:acetyl esterase/lipase